MRQQSETQFDELYVRQILADAAERGRMTRGAFDMLTKPYLAAGYAREVAEAERQYFRDQTTFR